MGDLPRAGTGQEIYLVPNLTVAPSSASEEYGLEPGIPTPASTNRSSRRLGVTGSIGESNKPLLPITITVEGTASLKAGLQDRIDQALTGNGVKIQDLIRQVKRIIRPTAGGVPVPRFGVTRNGQPVMGIDPNFSGTAFSTLTAPAGYVMPANVYAPSAPMVLDAWGRLLCCYLVEDDSGGANDGKHRIVAYYFDQAIHTDWQAAVSVSDWGSDWVLNNGAILNTPHLALVNYRGDVYALVSDAGTIASSVTGSLLVYRLDTSGSRTPPWTFEQIGNPIRFATIKGVLANGGLAAVALPDRVVVAVGAVGLQNYGFREETRSIWVGQSADMEQWSEASDNGGGFISLGAFEPILPLESDGSRLSQKITRVRMHLSGDPQRGWAVTDTGRIYATQDGGASWVQQNSPVSVPLYDITPVSGNGDAIIAYACGASGCVIKTTDSGVTWKIVSIAAGEAQKITDNDLFLDAESKSREPIGDGPLYAMAWYDSQTGWVVGTNKIAVTIKGGDGGWRKVEPKETTATYTSVIAIDSTTILVGGAIQRNRTKSDGLASDLKRYRFVRITDALTDDGYKSGKYAFHGETTDDNYRIESIFKRSATQAYACGRGGVLLYSADINTTTPTWTPLPATSPSGDFTDIIWREGKSGSTPTDAKNEFIVATTTGLICRSVDNGNNWVVQHVATESAGGSVAVITTDTTGDDDAVILYAGGSGLWRTDLSAIFEAFPTLLPTSSGELLLATANLQAGRVEIRRSRDRGMTFERLSLAESATITFTPQTTFSTLADTTLRPDLSIADDGTILLTAGSGGVACLDGTGTEWVTRDSKQLALPLGQLAITNAATQYRSRLTLPYGGGRLFTTSVNASGDIETRTAREWSTTSLIFCPVNPQVPQWIGVDDVRVVWPGISVPKGESWTINAEYRFPARHVVVETRQMYWRNEALSIASSDPVTFLWDRQHADILAALGDGAAWNMTAAGIFGPTFRKATLAISIPSYNAATWPTSAANYTEFSLDGAVAQALIRLAPDNSSTGTPYNVIAVGGVSWVPGQFKPGSRRYYAEIDTGVPSVCYEIVDNGTDFLLVKRNENSFGVSAGHLVTIVGDRLWCDGTGGYRNGVPAESLLHSPYEHGRLVRLSIPPQPTLGGYAKIEGLVVGRHVPVTVKTGEGEYQRDRYDRGFQWQVSQQSEEEISQSGARAIETFGPPLRKWSYSYTAAQWFDVQATLQPILGQMKRPFAIVFDHNDPLGTLEWVWMSREPDLTHAGGDLFTLPMELSEVG